MLWKGNCAAVAHEAPREDNVTCMSGDDFAGKSHGASQV